MVKRFRLLCDDKCNMVGKVYMYTNPQIAPLNLRNKVYNNHYTNCTWIFVF